MKQEFDLADSKIGFLYATMNGWVQNWVQGEMCCKLGSIHLDLKNHHELLKC